VDLIRNVSRGLVAVGFALVATVASTGPANAAGSGGDKVGAFGKNCTWPLCGSVTNSHGSERKLVISDDWSAERGTKKVVNVGESSSKYIKDTDAFWVPTGCKAIVFGATYGQAGAPPRQPAPVAPDPVLIPGGDQGALRPTAVTPAGRAGTASRGRPDRRSPASRMPR
jgi:hypothetical protein